MIGRVCVVGLALLLAACAGAMWAMAYLGAGEAGAWAWAGAACVAIVVAVLLLGDAQEGGEDDG